ncbi:MAG: ATP-binding protein [Alphaproteobacteria bacterium]
MSGAERGINVNGDCSKSFQFTGDNINFTANMCYEESPSQTSRQAEPALIAAEIIAVLGPASRELLSWPQETGGLWIERDELAQLREHAMGGDSVTVALLGGPGSGKSALLARLGKELAAEGRALLALKADTLPTEIRTLQDLDTHLGMPASAADCLRRLAAEQPVVLLIDQLDALGDLMDLKSSQLSVLLRLISEVRNTPRLVTIVSCRDFEYQHDVRLARIGAQEVRLSNPPWDKVVPVLKARGCACENWPQAIRDILCTPQHLKVFIDFLAVENGNPQFDTYQQMLEQVFEQRVIKAHGTTTANAAYAVARAIAEQEMLWLPRARFDRDKDAIDRLIGAGLLTDGGDVRKIGFRHQTVFDFVRARAFITDNTDTLKDFVLPRQNGLFVRPVVWSILTYLRPTDGKAYHCQMDALWQRDDLRPHLRQLLAEFMAQQTNPTTEETSRLLPLIDNAAWRNRLFPIMRNSPGWFAKIKSRLPSLMQADDQTAWSVGIVLRGALTHDPDAVINLIESHWSDRHSNVIITLSDVKHWTEPLVRLGEHALRSGSISTFYASSLVNECAHHDPVSAVRLVAAKLRHDIEEAQGKSRAAIVPKLPGDASITENDVLSMKVHEAVKPVRKIVNNFDWHGLSKIAEKAPAEFIKHIWPLFENIFDFLIEENTGLLIRYIHTSGEHIFSIAVKIAMPTTNCRATLCRPR